MQIPKLKLGMNLQVALNPTLKRGENEKFISSADQSAIGNQKSAMFCLILPDFSWSIGHILSFSPGFSLGFSVRLELRNRFNGLPIF
jgi:hypothetical protein